MYKCPCWQLLKGDVLAKFSEKSLCRRVVMLYLTSHMIIVFTVSFCQLANNSLRVVCCPILVDMELVVRSYVDEVIYPFQISLKCVTSNELSICSQTVVIISFLDKSTTKLNVCYTSISKSVELTTQKNHIGVSLKLEIVVSLYIGIPENMKEDEENKE